MENLRLVTECRCAPAWRDRGLHETHCISYCREDVEVLADVLWWVE